jgi:hypothetical protein
MSGVMAVGIFGLAIREEWCSDGRGRGGTSGMDPERYVCRRDVT